MAQLISVKLSRFDGSPWGFRLQGGKDFGTPLVVQKVNNGSPAEAAGLRAGDAVIRVNSTDMFNLRHKDAQDVIVKAGNNFEITVQRGGSTWRPSVSPVSASIPSPQPSLPLNGTSDGTVKSIVNKQYNSPVGIYSEETIAETLSAQAEVLAGGVLGVNFKKNEKNYNAQNSEVFKMVQEADKEPKTPEPVPARTEFYSSASHMVGGRSTSPRSPTPLSAELGHPPAFPQKPEQQQQQQQPVPASPSGKPAAAGGGAAAPASTRDGLVVCNNCDNPIYGVFVRIKDKNLHVECFKCSTCGTSLKNVGYYNINNKLYCDIHAKMVARQNTAPVGHSPLSPPAGLGQKTPANTISTALSNVAPLSPSLSNHGSSSPQPFSNYTPRAYSPETRECEYKNAYNNSQNNSNGRGEGKGSLDARTYTSTLTIQTSGRSNGQTNGQSNGQQSYDSHEPQCKLDYNRNPTNEHLNSLDNKLHKLTEDIRDFAFDRQIQQRQQQQQRPATSAPGNQTPLRAFKAPSSNSIGGPKPFIGSSITNQNYSSTSSTIINTGSSSTLPRPQSQSITGNFSTLPKPKSSPFKAATSFNPKPRPFSLIA